MPTMLYKTDDAGYSNKYSSGNEIHLCVKFEFL